MSSTYATLRGIFQNASKPASKPASVRAMVAKLINPKPTSPHEEAIASFVKKFKENCDEPRFRSHLSVYKSAVRRLCSSGSFYAIRDILEHQKHYPEIKDERFAVRLITLYGKAKMFDDARRVFDELPSLDCERTSLSFNGLLSACLHSEKYEMIRELFNDMPEKYEMIRELFNDMPEKLSVIPTTCSYNTLIKALCDEGSLDNALLLLDEMSKNDIQHDVVTFNTLINALGDADRYSEAEKIWALMEDKGIEPNARTYNAMVRALVRDGRFQEAVSIVEEMKKAKVKPDSFTYNAMLKGFVDQGNMEEVKTWFKKMNEDECSPDLATFGMLIPFACDKEDFGYAYILCVAGLRKKGRVYEALVQRVVTGLAATSMTEQAHKLAKMAKFKSYKGTFLEEK